MINILAIGYYDDYNRFFKKIKEGFINKAIEVDFKYINIYPSGFFYGLMNGFESSLPISFVAWIKVFFNKEIYKSHVNSNFYKGVNLDKVTMFERDLNNFNDKQVKFLKLQACAYIDIIEKIFSKYNPEISIISDDSRLVIEIVKYFSLQNNIKIFYFEQGPFGTTILDKEGVNANASVRNYKCKYDFVDKDEKLKQINNFLSKNKVMKYKRVVFYRGFDYIYEYIFNKTIFYPIDLTVPKCKYIDKKIYKNLKSLKKFNISQIDDSVINILLILQVPSDVNLIYHSPFYKNHFELTKAVIDSIPVNSNLIIREHPLYKSKYEPELYELIRNNKNIYIDDNSNLNDLFNNVSLVIVNNSTVGIESIAKLKNTIVLGNSYYDNNEICFKLLRKDDLKLLIEKALKEKKI